MIQEKDNIRLRIVGTRVDANDIVSIVNFQQEMYLNIF